MTTELKTIPRAEHNISRRNLDPEALKILYRLHRAGFTAYLVGGGLRDLLLSRKPKDFDICTSAHPGDVKKLFRNSRIIGRRFRLVHVFFQQKIIEVSTFRRQAEFQEGGEDEHDLLIRRENTFGTAVEDALRRDFTINGLFYDIGTFSIIDYVGGLEDLRAGVMRAIGDPDIRFREDPVRMLRAIKFASRLGFGIEEKTWDAIVKFHEDIQKCPKPRVLEEVYRILGSGASRRAAELLLDSGAFGTLFPEVNAILAERPPLRERLLRGLDALDELVVNGIAVPNAVLVGVLMDPLIAARPSGAEGGDAFYEWLETAVRPFCRQLTVSRRDQEVLGQCLAVQPRFELFARGGMPPRALTRKLYFEHALVLFVAQARARGMELQAALRFYHRCLSGQGGVSPTEAPAAGEGGAPGRPRRRRRRGGRRLHRPPTAG